MGFHLGNFSISSAFQRLVALVRGLGVTKTLSVCVSMIDDWYVRSFDRKYRVRTSGHVSLASTSFDPSKLRHATAYGPVNAWAFRSLLSKLKLPHALHFVDLGCGLGRACILAAEYGFERVTGVELAPELCAGARKNLSTCRLPASQTQLINIVQGDVLDYCGQTDDDLFFIYRAFSLEFLRTVLRKLAARADEEKKVITLIYSLRLDSVPSPEVVELSRNPEFRKIYEGGSLGQEFHVYQYGG
jgi:SAM-dependent methyltransferase